MIVINSHLKFRDFHEFMLSRGMTGGEWHIQADGYGIDGPYKVSLLSQKAKDLEPFIQLKFG